MNQPYFLSQHELATQESNSFVSKYSFKAKDWAVPFEPAS